MNLRQIDIALLALFESILSEEGDISLEAEEKLAKLQISQEEKYLAITNYIQNLEDTVEACKNETKRISKMKKQSESKIEYYKNYLKQSLQSNGIQEKQVGTNKLSFRNSSYVEITNIEALPVRLLRYSLGNISNFDGDIEVALEEAFGIYAPNIKSKEANKEAVEERLKEIEPQLKEEIITKNPKLADPKKSKDLEEKMTEGFIEMGALIVKNANLQIN